MCSSWVTGLAPQSVSWTARRAPGIRLEGQSARTGVAVVRQAVCACSFLVMCDVVDLGWATCIIDWRAMNQGRAEACSRDSSVQEVMWHVDVLATASFRW